jgi:tetratricopeptide (TPR) repeat protein
VYRFEGTVTQYAGDGLMALFGAPIAHEDHAQRACYAVLHLRDQLRRYADELRMTRGLSFSVRMGLNSGEVVVGRIGDDLHMDYTAHGHAVGLAARMEQIAAPDRIYMTHATARLVQDYFELRGLGASMLKGLADPVEVFELVGPGRYRTRLEVSRARGFSRFVGRDQELQQLDRALALALAGTGQVLTVIGEAGVGKSRLCDEFVERARARGIAVYQGRAPAHGSAVPFLLILQLLRSLFGITDQDRNEEARRKITDGLRLDDALRGLLPIVFDFLRVTDPDVPSAFVDPEARQRQLFDFVRRFVVARGEREPAIILLDDLQWADGGSEAFLGHIADAVRSTRMLLLGNARPEYRTAWARRHSLELQPLGDDDSRALLTALLGSDPSLAGLAAALHQRTGGNAFFLEEVILALIETGVLTGSAGAYRLARPVNVLQIPASVRVVLHARIDRLDERDKTVLQTAAVIGKRVGEPILRRVVDLPDAVLAAALERLIGADLLFQEALLPEAEYAFKHPLTQEVAYHSLLAARRTALHGAVARAIEASARSADERCEDLAHHFSRSADHATAAHYLELAGDKAAASFSLKQARAQYRTAVALVDSLPESPERARQRIDVTLKWAEAGLIGPEPEQLEALRVSHELATRLQDALRTARCVYWIGWIEYALGNQVDALVHIERCIAMAEAVHDDRLVAQLQLILAAIYAARTEYEAALERVHEGVALRRASGGNPATVGIAYALGTRALAYGDMGRFDDAHQDIDDALGMLETLGRRSVTGSLTSIRGIVCSFRGDWEGTRGALPLCREIGDLIDAPLLHGIASTLEGAARCFAEDEPAGLDALRAAVQHLESTGVLLTMSWNYAAYAEALALFGKTEEARAAAHQALQREAAKDRLGAAMAQRALAIAAGRAGDWPEARARHAAALQIAEAKASRREVGLADFRYGEVLLAAGDEAGRPLLERAVATFADLRMPWYWQRARRTLSTRRARRRATR